MISVNLSGLPQEHLCGPFPLNLVHTMSFLENHYGETMPVIDPVGQFSGTFSLHLPWSCIEDTEGLQRFLRNQLPHPSLCMLFQAGRCRAQEKCNQVHAHPEAVAQVRDYYRTSRQSTCCSFHSGIYQNDDVVIKNKQVVMVTYAGAYVQVPLERTDKTAYLDKILLQAATTNSPGAYFQMSYVCRLHQKKRCGYANQCGHVHLCREYWQQLFSAYPWLQCEPDPSNRVKKSVLPAVEHTVPQGLVNIRDLLVSLPVPAVDILHDPTKSPGLQQQPIKKSSPMESRITQSQEGSVNQIHGKKLISSYWRSSGDIKDAISPPVGLFTPALSGLSDSPESPPLLALPTSAVSLQTHPSPPFTFCLNNLLSSGIVEPFPFLTLAAPEDITCMSTKSISTSSTLGHELELFLPRGLFDD